MDSLISFKKKFFKPPSTSAMPKIVKVESMSNLNSSLSSEIPVRNVNEKNTANVFPTSIIREKLNESDQIVIESSPEQEKEAMKGPFSNEINESFEFLENHTFYDQDEQETNSNDNCFHNQFDKEKSDSSFFCYKEEKSSSDDEDGINYLDNDDEDDYDADKETYDESVMPVQHERHLENIVNENEENRKENCSSDLIAVEKPKKSTDCFGNMIKQEKNDPRQITQLNNQNLSSKSQTNDNIFKYNQPIDSDGNYF
jgi:hypothetical protein